MRWLVEILRAIWARLTAPRKPGRRPLPKPTARTASPRTSSARAPRGLSIEYAPERDGEADPGEIVWMWVPFEDDPSRGKDRPVLVLGRRGARLVGVQLTSKPYHRDQVEVGVGAWDREGRVSYAKVDRLVEVVPGEVRREGAILERGRFDRVVAEVQERFE